MAYASESRALALLEVLVHLDTLPRRSYVMASAQVPLSLIARPAPDDLPRDWLLLGEQPLLKRYGDQFLEGQSFLAFQVPSVVLPAEYNYLINPLHPAFSSLTFGKLEDFGFDTRLRP